MGEKIIQVNDLTGPGHLNVIPCSQTTRIECRVHFFQPLLNLVLFDGADDARHAIEYFFEQRHDFGDAEQRIGASRWGVFVVVCGERIAVVRSLFDIAVNIGVRDFFARTDLGVERGYHVVHGVFGVVVQALGFRVLGGIVIPFELNGAGKVFADRFQFHQVVYAVGIILRSKVYSEKDEGDDRQKEVFHDIGDGW